MLRATNLVLAIICQLTSLSAKQKAYAEKSLRFGDGTIANPLWVSAKRKNNWSYHPAYFCQVNESTIFTEKACIFDTVPSYKCPCEEILPCESDQYKQFHSEQSHCTVNQAISRSRRSSLFYSSIIRTRKTQRPVGLHLKNDNAEDPKYVIHIREMWMIMLVFPLVLVVVVWFFKQRPKQIVLPSESDARLTDIDFGVRTRIIEMLNVDKASLKTFLSSVFDKHTLQNYRMDEAMLNLDLYCVCDYEAAFSHIQSKLPYYRLSQLVTVLQKMEKHEIVDFVILSRTQPTPDNVVEVEARKKPLVVITKANHHMCKLSEGNETFL